MYSPKYHDRQSLRLKGYNYASQGYYFITIITKNRERLLGEIKEGKMQLSYIGMIVLEEWRKSTLIRENIRLDEFVIMPDHFHAIVVIEYSMSNQEPGKFESPSKNLGSLVRSFKSAVTQRVKILATVDLPGNTFLDRSFEGINLNHSIWQRNYHDRIIRDARELENTRCYIRENPLKW